MSICALWALLILTLALFAGVARAEVPTLVANGNFASDNGLGVAVDNSCYIRKLTGGACTAADSSNGDMFVTGSFGEGPPEIEKFDASDKLLSPPSPFAAGVNSGAAVNPTNGDLYVASPFANEIDTYDPNTGELISSFPVPPFFTEYTNAEVFGNLAQIATDSAGDVYVPNGPDNEVLEYSPTPTVVGGVAVPLATFTGSEKHALKGPTGVAIDSSGDLWVADFGNNRIVELNQKDEQITEIKSEGVRALALYEHEGAVDVLAIVSNSADPCGTLTSPCAHLVEYSSSGAQLADIGAGELEVIEALPLSMVAVDEASGRVYVTDGWESRVLVFQPPVAPAIGQESAVEVGTSEAKLSALVNPGGAETTYRFEYDTREYSEGEGPHGVSVPFPEGSAGQGFSSRTVWASAGGLAPGTTYHYRVVVTNGVGKPVVGPDQTFTTETAAQVACPNEQFRGGFSAALPDCRAYEAVVPPNKASAQPLTYTANSQFSQAANDGNRFTWNSNEVLPGSQSAGTEDIATRGASGWSNEDALPLQYYNADRCGWDGGAGVEAFSPDLSKAVIQVNRESGAALEFCLGGEPVEVVPGETPFVKNLLLRENTTGAYQLIDVPPPGVEATSAGLIAYSADLNLIIFNNGAALTSEAPNGGTFEWSEGVVRLLKLTLPSGAPVEGSIVSISPDGSDLFFTAHGNLYVRVNRERTIQVNAARGGPGPGGGGSLAAVTADDSQVFFTADASAGLTSDTEPGSGANLYRFDIDTGQLSDLTPVAHAEAALTGISEDGSYVYFTAQAVMPGSQANQFGETAESGQSNLYLYHGGTITFVKHGGGVGLSSNGAFFEFGSGEIDLYSAAANRFECASCNPDGEAPTAGGVEESYKAEGGLNPIPHPVSNNGQVFFQTSEALLPRDTNGVADVYEYDYASGLHLISTGTSSSESRLLGASASGNDVFFLGRQALLPGEPNGESLAIYDARVDGGFPVTVVPSCTTADACRAAPEPQPSIFGEPSSQTFSGAGNLASPPPPVLKTAVKSKKCKKGLVKSKKGRCEKGKGKKKKAKAKKSAHANRRATR